MKFTGCNCQTSGKTCSQDSTTCPCRLLNRECDPDLCHTCGAAQTANPLQRHEGPPAHSCRNTDIQRGIRAPLIVGESSHPAGIGFGAFTATAITRGSFIAEYVGEIISQEESDLRAEIYDKLNISFFFTLNDEVVIDSYRYGNVERFINHSKKNANCVPVVKLVNGEHRIGFFATKDLKAGTELWFDYGTRFGDVQGLVEMEPLDEGKRKRKGHVSKGKGRRRGRVVAGLGDVEEEEGNTSIIGSEFLSAVGAGVQDDDEGGEHEEDDVEVRRPSRRPRRNVRMPKKYTR
jgi:hypothetical protein